MRMHLEPLRRRHLVGAQRAADVVVEDLGRGARQRAEARVAQPREVVAQRHLGGVRALPDLERRERVDVQVGQLGPDRLDQLDVPLAREARVDAALQAHLGAAAVPRLVAAAQDLLAPQQVRGAAQVLGQLALGERAEAALEVADVGVVDVPADDVGDVVAVALGAHAVGRAGQQVDLGAAGRQQRGGLRLRVVGRLERLGERGRARRRDAASTTTAACRRRRR